MNIPSYFYKFRANMIQTLMVEDIMEPKLIMENMRLSLSSSAAVYVMDKRLNWLVIDIRPYPGNYLLMLFGFIIVPFLET